MHRSRFDVLICGSLHLDIIVRASRLPDRDETAVGQSWSEVCGGKGGNQAVQASRLGARTAMIGRVGSDDFGARLLAHLDGAGVDRTSVGVSADAKSGMSVAIVEAGGDYGAVIVSGANLTIEPEDAVAAWAGLGGARVLVLQNEIPHTVNLAIARAAREAGAIIVFNAAPARESITDLLDLIDVLVINRVEAGALSGTSISDRSSAAAALPALAARHRTVVITLGGDGVVVGGLGAPACEMEAEPIKVDSTHGAGDCFVGALAFRLASGDDAIEACRFANAAAARFLAGRSDQTVR
jgi:ribokinase